MEKYYMTKDLKSGRRKMSATYIGKYYDGDYVYLEYEYRGKRYEVYENRAKGNEPLSWQHKSQQGYIDKLIEIENKPKTDSKPFNINEIFEILGWD